MNARLNSRIKTHVIFIYALFYGFPNARLIYLRHQHKSVFTAHIFVEINVQKSKALAVAEIHYL